LEHVIQSQRITAEYSIENEKVKIVVRVIGNEEIYKEWLLQYDELIEMLE
jgi:hypothetical protein